MPLFGIEPAIIDPVSGEEISGNDVEGVLAFKQPWPSMARTVWGAHKRYMDTYLNVYKGYYVRAPAILSTMIIANTECSLLVTVLAVIRMDTTGSAVVSTTLSTCPDIVCLLLRSRLPFSSTVSEPKQQASIQKSNHSTDQVAEAAVVGIPDELTGQAVNAFVALKEGTETSEQVSKDLIMQVRKSIGPFAAPKGVYVVDDLPKTRSGKIMRRILRKILSGEEDGLGDISTLSDPSVVSRIIDTVHAARK